MFDYAKRVRNSLVGVLFGVVLLPCSIALHAWNEYRTVHRARGLAEASTSVQSIADPRELDTSLQDKLVHLAGLAETEEVLRDPEYYVSRPAIRLARRVEMYQWYEHTRTTGSGNNKKTTYEYNRDWKADPINSSSFHQPSGHENPSMNIRSQVMAANEVHIGAYRLSEVLRDSMENWSEVPIPQNDILENVPEASRSKYEFSNNVMYFSESMVQSSSPKVGDYRIRFEEVVPSKVSLIAQLNSNTFREYRTSNGEPIERLFIGTLSSAEIIQRLQSENTVLAWVLRVVGFVLCVVGCGLMMGPISTILSFVPFLGQITGGITFLIAAILGFVISLLTIGISWVVVRPLLGTSLIIFAIAGLWLIRRLRTPGNAAAEIPPPVPPPIPS